ncbi:YMGG-like glycine zipper-containing protein [Dyadobacter sp. 32]|uniref:YMGG-like glycine zipper-containing protein n=1 Tax=Dyadobacter sp. 32 TaxID=538966 RepID=UPI0039C730B4
MNLSHSTDAAHVHTKPLCAYPPELKTGFLFLRFVWFNKHQTVLARFWNVNPKHPTYIMKLLVSVFCAIGLLTGCNSSNNKEAEVQQAKQMAVDSMKHVIAKQAVVDSMNAVMAEREKEIKAEQAQAEQEEKDRQALAVKNETPAAAPVAKRKKKWNNTAKGAVIGAGTGAVAGAIIHSKKPVEGALIGTVVGAGVGTATGAIVDDSKKKKNKAN